MVDTPRTLEELLDIFATNPSGNISAQDLRDAIVSFVDPVPGGGLDTGGTVDQSTGFYTAVTVGAKTYTSGSHLPFDIGSPDYEDGLALRQTGGSYVSTYASVTWPSGSWWRVPPGLWFYAIGQRWDSNATGSRELALSVIDDRIENGAHPMWAAPNYFERLPFITNGGSALIMRAEDLQTSFNPGQQLSSGFVGVSAAMVADSDGQSAGGDGWAFGGMTKQDSGSDRTADLRQLSFVKIGNVT